jgi:hypothetical protein
MPDTAIPNERRSAVVVRRAARSFVFFLGIGALSWAGFVLPSFWRQWPLHGIASAYLQGERFSKQSLSEQVPHIATAVQTPLCNPVASHDAVAIRLAIMEEAEAKHSGPLTPSDTAPLHAAIQRALACGPDAPFIWLTLFWLETRERGVTPDNLKYLRLSYALGPNEGWIAIWRNRLAVSLFDQLPDSLQGEVLDEFVKLVGTGRLYQQTADIFAIATPALQKRLSEHLVSLGSLPREIFAIVIDERGLNVTIPNTAPPGLQPWNRSSLPLKLPDVELPASQR